MRDFMKYMRLKLSCQKGMTLIDVSIAMVVIALIAYPLLKQYDLYVSQQKVVNVGANFSDINSAIEIFYNNERRYPCPANITLARTNANYGLEMFDTATGTCLTSAGASAGTGHTTPVSGMAPFKTLGLTEKSAYDSWGNRLLYVVSANTASTALVPVSYDYVASPPAAATLPPTTLIMYGLRAPPSGAVCTWPIVTASNPAASTRCNGWGHYVIVSHGPNGEGAYNQDGVLVAACPASSVRESENCDNDNVFFSRRAVTSVADIHSNTAVGSGASEVAGANFLDDYTFLRASGPTSAIAGNSNKFPFSTEKWPPVNPNTGILSNYKNRVGIGINDPDDWLEVDGDLQVSSGNIQTSDICNEDETHCFKTMDISGNLMVDGDEVGKIWCEDGLGFATGVGDRDAVCNPATVDYFGGVTGNCPGGIRGITAGGVTC